MKRSTRRRFLFSLVIPLLSYVPFCLFFFGGLLSSPATNFPLVMVLTILWPFLMVGSAFAYSRTIRNLLREKGYEWIGTIGAGQLYIALGSRIIRIPPRDQLATLPGYKEGDIESIIDLMEDADPRR